MTLWRQRRSQATVTLVSGGSLRSGEPAFQPSLCARLTAPSSQPFQGRFINLLAGFFCLRTLFNKSFEVMEQLRKSDSTASKDEQPNHNRTVSERTASPLAGPGPGPLSPCSWGAAAGQGRLAPRSTRELPRGGAAEPVPSRALSFPLLFPLECTKATGLKASQAWKVPLPSL